MGEEEEKKFWIFVLIKRKGAMMHDFKQKLFLLFPFNSRNETYESFVFLQFLSFLTGGLLKP